MGPIHRGIHHQEGWVWNKCQDKTILMGNEPLSHESFRQCHTDSWQKLGWKWTVNKRRRLAQTMMTYWVWKKCEMKQWSESPLTHRKHWQTLIIVERRADFASLPYLTFLCVSVPDSCSCGTDWYKPKLQTKQYIPILPEWSDKTVLTEQQHIDYEYKSKV